MKYVFWLLMLTSVLRAQTTPVYLFNVPTPGTEVNVWGSLLNSNMFTVESLLTGASPLTALNVTGNLTAGGTTTLGATQVNGTMTLGSGSGGQLAIGQLKAVGSAPTCAFTSGGGTSPTCTLDAGSTNLAGIVILTTGTGSPAGSGTFTLTFNSPPFGANKPVCEYRPSNQGGGTWNGLVGFADQTASTTSDLSNFYNGTTPTALTASTIYWIAYQCIAK
jgi:hypothetical protein